MLLFPIGNHMRSPMGNKFITSVVMTELEVSLLSKFSKYMEYLTIPLKVT